MAQQVPATLASDWDVDQAGNYPTLVSKLAGRDPWSFHLAFSAGNNTFGIIYDKSWTNVLNVSWHEPFGPYDNAHLKTELDKYNKVEVCFRLPLLPNNLNQVEHRLTLANLCKVVHHPNGYLLVVPNI